MDVVLEITPVTTEPSRDVGETLLCYSVRQNETPKKRKTIPLVIMLRSLKPETGVSRELPNVNHPIVVVNKILFY